MTLRPTSYEHVTFVVLLRGDDGDEMARLMATGLSNDSQAAAEVLLPDLAQGLDYLAADGELADKIRQDWIDNVQYERTRPVFVVVYESGLERFIGGLDSDLVIGVPDVQAARRCQQAADHNTRVITITTTDPRVLTEFAMQTYMSPDPAKSLFRADSDFSDWWVEWERPAVSTQPADIEWSDRLAEDVRRVIEEDESQSASPGSGSASESAPTWRPPRPVRLDRPAEPARAGPPDVPPHILKLAPHERKQAYQDYLQTLDRKPASPDARAPLAAARPAEQSHDDTAASTPTAAPVEQPSAPPDSFLGYLSRAPFPAVQEVEDVPLGRPQPQVQSPTKAPRPSPAAALGGESVASRLQAKVLAQLKGKPKRLEVSSETIHKLSEVRGLTIVVGNPKGGVGKTASAVGLGMYLGRASTQIGWRAALCEANTGNTSQWGSVGIDRTRCTMRRLVDDLNAGLVPPDPAGARKAEGLVIYPEVQGNADGYTFDELERSKRHILKACSSLVVDLPNREPEPGSREGEMVARWLRLADVVVIPVDSDPNAFVMAHRLINHIETIVKQERGGRPIPVVAAYLGPLTKEVRADPSTREDVEKLRERCEALIEVPRDERVMLALRTDKTIEEVSPAAARAYLLETTAVVDAAWASRTAG